MVLVRLNSVGSVISLMASVANPTVLPVVLLFFIQISDYKFSLFFSGFILLLSLTYPLIPARSNDPIYMQICKVGVCDKNMIKKIFLKNLNQSMGIFWKHIFEHKQSVSKIFWIGYLFWLVHIKLKYIIKDTIYFYLRGHPKNFAISLFFIFITKKNYVFVKKWLCQNTGRFEYFLIQIFRRNQGLKISKFLFLWMDFCSVMFSSQWVLKG